MTRSAPTPPVARLASVLQEFKVRTGLSLAQLANATTFSKSSWQRYLNGTSLPPRSAVVELSRLAQQPADHPLALLDIARTDRAQDTEPPAGKRPLRQHTGARGETPAESPSHQAPAGAPTDTGPSGAVPTAPVPARPAPPPDRRTTLLTALASLLALALALGVLALLRIPPPHGKQAPPSSGPAASAAGPLCRHHSCQDEDPITTRCGAGPQTLAEHETATGAWIQIRYSPECGTSWVRMWGAAVNDRVGLRPGDHNGPLHSTRVTSRAEADTYVHTLMSVVRPGVPMEACFTPAAGGARECFEALTDRTVTGTTP